MWMIDYEDDIASDLSAFHRIDDPSTIDTVRYFSLALRLTAYAGVMAGRAEKLRQEEEKGGSGAHSVGQPATTADRPAKVSDDVALSMLGSEFIDHSTEGEV